MSYTLYIKDRCPGCTRALAEMQRRDLSFEVINIEREPCPDGIMVVPALFAGAKLLAYGPDIPDFLKK